jgi:hypothetical protein
MGSITDFVKNRIPAINKTSDKELVLIGGFTSLCYTNDSTSLTSDIPEHYLEDGSNSSDHVIKKPIILEISGNASDVFIPKESETSYAKRLDSTSGTISRYTDFRTNGQINQVRALATSVQDSYNKAQQAIDDGQSLYGTFGSENVSKPDSQKFYEFMENLYESKTPIKIEVQYRVFENMIVSSFSRTRNSNFANGFDWSISAKQIRFAEIEEEYRGPLSRNPSAGLNGQAGASSENGVQAGTSTATSSVNSTGVSTSTWWDLIT